MKSDFERFIDYIDREWKVPFTAGLFICAIPGFLLVTFTGLGWYIDNNFGAHGEYLRMKGDASALEREWFRLGDIDRKLDAAEELIRTSGMNYAGWTPDQQSLFRKATREQRWAYYDRVRHYNEAVGEYNRQSQEADWDGINNYYEPPPRSLKTYVEPPPDHARRRTP